MYQIAESEINRGLSRGARILLGSSALIFALVMILVAPDDGKKFSFYGIGFFFALIAAACAVTGRRRRFIGSIIGLGLFLLTSYFFAYEALSGAPLIAPRGSPSIASSALCFLFFGIPGARYLWKARFGFGGAVTGGDTGHQ